MGQQCPCLAGILEPPKNQGGFSALGSGAPRKSASQQEIKEERAVNRAFDVKLKFLLGQVPLFRSLPQDVLPIVAEHCEAATFFTGATVVKEGDEGNEFFLIRSGSARVHKLNEHGVETKIRMLKSGDFFGEKALLFDAYRSATVVAETSLDVLKVSRDKFHELGLHEKLKFPKRHAVGFGLDGHSVVTQTPSTKTRADRAFISDALRKNERLHSAVLLDTDRNERMIDIAWKQNIQSGMNVITEGDVNADYFYIIQDGTFETTIKAELSEDDRMTSSNSMAFNDFSGPRTMSRGDSFGEIALLYLVPRTATVQAQEDSTVWVFDRDNFKQILLRASEAQIQKNRKILDRVPILESLFQDEKEALAAGLVEMHYIENEVILQQDEISHSFHILLDGKVSVSQDGASLCELSASPHGEVQFFGEKALLKSDARTATVKVISETAKTLVLDRESFNLLLGPLEEIMAHKSSKTRRRTSFSDMLTNSMEAPKKRRNVTQDRLRKLGLLGCGGFGAVELHEDCDTGETFAVKVISKGFIVKMGMQECICNEKQILTLVDSPFIIKLYGTHNGPENVHLIMEPGLGGDLYQTYRRKCFYGLALHARYYAAGVICAFDYLHSHRIIYRDMKPENLLMNDKGHLKLTDMGLAKFVIGRTYTTCGTPDYFAPEIINSSGHNNAVDWWALGVLIFELMAGHPPFESQHPLKTCAKVQKGIDKVTFYKKCQGPVEKLVKALMRPEPSDRLPMRPGGVQSLRRHAWFADFDWGSHWDGTMPAPYVPAVKNQKDLTNFRARPEDLPKALPYVDDGSGWDQDF